MIKLPNTYAFPPKIDASIKKIGIKSPWHIALAPHVIFGMVGISKHWFAILGVNGVIVYWVTLLIIGVLIFCPEDLMIGEMAFLIFRNLLLNGFKDFIYEPEQKSVFEPDWSVKTIKSTSKGD